MRWRCSIDSKGHKVVALRLVMKLLLLHPAIEHLLVGTVADQVIDPMIVDPRTPITDSVHLVVVVMVPVDVVVVEVEEEEETKEAVVVIMPMVIERDVTLFATNVVFEAISVSAAFVLKQMHLDVLQIGLLQLVILVIEQVVNTLMLILIMVMTVLNLL